MFQYILDQAVSERRTRALAFGALRRIIMRYVDPIVSSQINGRRIAINFAHQFPIYRRQEPAFCKNFSRLCAFLRREFGVLRMIDVGANVGDSYCLADPHPSDAYLLIEGDARYFSLLERNTEGDPTVRRIRALISDGSEASGDLVAQHGSARVVTDAKSLGSDSGRAFWTTLDKILDTDDVFTAPHLLKTDVEGYDPRVLRGARKHIAGTSPVLFFEHYPRLLQQVGESDTDIFSVLAQLGYSVALVYDYFGFLVATINVADANLVSDLVAYARQRGAYYYDVCCFPDVFAEARGRFIESERKIASGGLPTR